MPFNPSTVTSAPDSSISLLPTRSKVVLYALYGQSPKSVTPLVTLQYIFNLFIKLFSASLLLYLYIVRVNLSKNGTHLTSNSNLISIFKYGFNL